MEPNFENPFQVIKGDICVLRLHSVDGYLKLSALRINWREWSGAFSILY